LRRTALRIARNEDCQNSCYFVAEQGLNGNNGSTQGGNSRRNERLRSGNAQHRMRKERARRTETRFPILLCLRFLRTSNRAPVHPVLPAACRDIALRTTDRQCRKKRSNTKQQYEHRREYAAQSVIRPFHCRLHSPTIVMMFSSPSSLSSQTSPEQSRTVPCGLANRSSRSYLYRQISERSTYQRPDCLSLEFIPRRKPAKWPRPATKALT
jgi:hypothetical protein